MPINEELSFLCGEAQVTSTMEALNAMELGDRSEWIAKADAALSSVK